MLDLEFRLKPSKQYLILISGALLISVGCVISLSAGMWMKLASLIWVVIYSGHLFWRYGLLRTKCSITSIRRHSDGRWLLHTPQQNYAAELRGDSTVTGLVSVLRFRVAQRRWPVSCVVFRDSLERGLYRKLLVVVKMG